MPLREQGSSSTQIRAYEPAGRVTNGAGDGQRAVAGPPVTGETYVRPDPAPIKPKPRKRTTKGKGTKSVKVRKRAGR